MILEKHNNPERKAAILSIQSSKVALQHYIHVLPTLTNYIQRLLSPSHTLSFLPTSLRAIVSSIARISIDDIHKVLRNRPLRLLTRVELVIPKEAVWVANGRAVAASDAAVVAVSVDLERRRAVQILSGILMDI